MLRVRVRRTAGRLGSRPGGAVSRRHPGQHGFGRNQVQRTRDYMRLSMARHCRRRTPLAEPPCSARSRVALWIARLWPASTRKLPLSGDQRILTCLFIESPRSEVRCVRPNHRGSFRIDSDLGKVARVAEGLEDSSPFHRRQVDVSIRAGPMLSIRDGHRARDLSRTRFLVPQNRTESCSCSPRNPPHRKRSSAKWAVLST
jgi:hypothetical protein